MDKLMMVKSAFIGIDGGELSIFRGLSNTGLLRSDLIDGFSPIGISTLDRGWATIFTGKDASFHGGFYWRPADNRYVLTEAFNSRMYQLPPIWSTVHTSGGRVGLMGVPTTFPASEVNGFYIASGGGGARLAGKDVLYPSNLQTLLTESGYVFDLRFADFVGKKPSDFVQALTLTETARWKVAKRLIKMHAPLDFFATVFKGGDIIQHFFWDRVKRMSKEGKISDALDRAIFDYYQTLVQILEEIVEFFKEGALVMASDHGFCGHEKSVNLAAILEKGGYATPKSILLKDRIKQLLKEWMPDRLKPRLRVMQRKVAMEGVWQVHAPSFAWEKSVTIPFKGLDGVYLNRKGKFHQGIVGDDAVSTICNEIYGYLKTLVDPRSGANVFETVSLRNDIYHGPLKDYMPDIIFSLPRGHMIETRPSGAGLVFPAKILPTSHKYMPGQGHIGIHSSPAMYSVFENGASKYCGNLHDLSELHSIMLDSCEIAKDRTERNQTALIDREWL
jgi:predicted AlkP superfamily phosphohydrolase/phosphomutase